MKQKHMLWGHERLGKTSTENIVRHTYGTYYLSATVGGKKFRKSLGTKSLTIAKIKRDEMMAELRAKAGRIKGSKGWTLECCH